MTEPTTPTGQRLAADGPWHDPKVGELVIRAIEREAIEQFKSSDEYVNDTRDHAFGYREGYREAAAAERERLHALYRERG